MSLRSASNSSLPPPPPFPAYHYLCLCFSSTEGAVAITVTTIGSVLFLLPLFIFVLYLGFQRWRQRGSGTTLSHSDVLTFHVVFRDLLITSGFGLICVGVYAHLPKAVITGTFLVSINCTGQMFFHLATCVDRYLAVVHPVTYLSLKAEKGVRTRNITVSCIWLLSFATIGFLFSTNRIAIALSYVYVMIFNIVVVSFCSISVLRVLAHPGPGEEAGARQKVDQFKTRALRTIMVILAVLLFVFGGNTLSFVIYALKKPGDAGRCVLSLSIFWCYLPSTVVLPLLFLHRSGKLPCCKARRGSE